MIGMKWLRVFATILLMAIGVADTKMASMPGPWGLRVLWAFEQFRLPERGGVTATMRMTTSDGVTRDATRDDLRSMRTYGSSPLLDAEMLRFSRDAELARSDVRMSRDYGRPEIVVPTARQAMLQRIVSDDWPTGTVVTAGGEPWAELVNRADLPDGDIKLDEHGAVITHPFAKRHSEDV